MKAIAAVESNLLVACLRAVLSKASKPAWSLEANEERVRVETQCYHAIEPATRGEERVSTTGNHNISEVSLICFDCRCWMEMRFLACTEKVLE